MKTKPFLLATAGSTVDGRVIDEATLREMASSYDPKTYAARLNIEHIRGISGDKPFRAYGDVVELSVAEVEVNFNGEKEKRLGLYGVFEVTEDAKALNEASQKVYPSIEILPNFGGKGFAYLAGCALTDSPAAIATDRLEFKRSLPGTICLARGDEGQGSEPALLEFAEAAGSADGEAGDKFLNKLFAGLENVFGKTTPKTDPKPEPKQGSADEPAAFTAADLQPVLETFGKNIVGEITGQLQGFRQELDGLAVKVKEAEKVIETTPAGNYTARPTGKGANVAKTDC
jgi:hypothetical protein